MLTDLEAELGVEDVKEVLGNYLSEDAVAVWDLLLTELGLTGGESTEILEATEAMEVDPPMMLLVHSHAPVHGHQTAWCSVRNIPAGIDGTGIYLLPDQQHGYTPIAHHGCGQCSSGHHRSQSPGTRNIQSPRSWKTRGFTKSGIPLKDRDDPPEKEAACHLK